MAKPDNAPRFLFWRITPLTARRLRTFRANKRGYWSLWIFILLFIFSMGADLVANDKPIVIWYDGGLYSPAFSRYAETTFGGEFKTETDYSDPYVRKKIREKGWMIWPMIPYSFDTPVLNLTRPAPTPPDWQNLLGTDDQARDLLARIIYGFRISVLFGLALTLFSSVVGVVMGAIQGYFGGWTDLMLQRFIEIWEAVPILFLLIFLSALIEPNFWWLLGIMLLFSWMSLVSVVRAEFLRARNLEYVRAARALGAGDITIMFRHVLPNAMVATLTFLPFILTASIVTLASLDFLGYGLPPGSASLGEVLRQGKTNLNAPWLVLTGFLTLAILLSLLVFVGEAVRDAFDPRKGVSGSGGEALGDPDKQGTAPAGDNTGQPAGESALSGSKA